MIEALNARYGDNVRRFVVADIVEDEPPAADLWLCRESLFHLTNSEVAQVLERWRRSGIPWFVATTTPTVTENADIETGYWRPLNLQAPPFSMEAPLDVLPDAAPGDPAKVLGVWRRQA